MMGRPRKTPDAVGGNKSRRLAAAAGGIQTGSSGDSVNMDETAPEAETPQPAEQPGPISLPAQPAAGPGRQRSTIAEPGPRQGLQPGWTRATVIVRDDLLTTLKDYAYTHRTTLKDLVNDALAAYVDGLDLTGLLHKG